MSILEKLPPLNESTQTPKYIYLVIYKSRASGKFACDQVLDTVLYTVTSAIMDMLNIVH